MKQIILYFLAFCIVVTFFSCDNKGDGGKETDTVENTLAETESEQTSLDEIKHLSELDSGKYCESLEFRLPDDFRQAVVDYMYTQASVEWVCSDSFGVKEEWAHWGINLDYRKNTKYTGLPYASSQVTALLFNRVLKDGKYTSDSYSWEEVHGVQCVSSILNSLQQVMVIDGWSYSLNPGSEAFGGKKLGGYKVDTKPIDSETHTSDVCKNNGEEVMFASYALLQKGDVVMKSDNTVHARMVVDTEIVLNETGRVDGEKSIVKCIEQTNSFDLTRSDHVKTTWFVDHEYTFENLYKNGYLPSTFAVYESGISRIPYLALDTEITSSMLVKGMLGGVVSSNYPLRYVVLEITDKNENTVKEYVSVCGMKDYSENLRKMSYPFFGDGLEKGEYTFILTAGLAIGEHEFKRVDFIVE